MQNIADKQDEAPERFIRGVSGLLAMWGMPATAGRVYGYLLLQSQPVGPDQIAVDLSISRAGAWAALRHLEQVRQIERFGDPGSKRALFAVTTDLARSLMNYSKFLGKMSALLSLGATLAEDRSAVSQLRKRSRFYKSVHEAMDASIEDLTTQDRESSAQ